jgi:hypothetical protein
MPRTRVSCSVQRRRGCRGEDAEDRRFTLELDRTAYSESRGLNAEDRRFMLGSKTSRMPRNAEDRRFTCFVENTEVRRFMLGSNDPGPRTPRTGVSERRGQKRSRPPNAEDRRFMPECQSARGQAFHAEDRRFTLGSNDPGPALICLSRARRWRAGHVCWVRRRTQDCTGIERREARVTSVCALVREPNWHGAGLTECDTRQLADRAEAVHAGEAE